MESERDKVQHAISLRDSFRRMRFLSPDSIRNHSQEIDSAGFVSALGESYEDLAIGIHENVQAAQRGEQPLLTRRDEPTYYVNGHPAAHKIHFRLGFDKDTPDYVSDYLKTRDGVYEVLVERSVESKNFSPVISTITSLKESTLANRFLNRLAQRKEPYPDMIAGDADSMLREIDWNNQQLEQFKNAVKTYAKEEAKINRLFELRRKLNDEKTGVLGALAIGARLKMGDIVFTASAMEKYIYGPLRPIASLPTAPEQLIAKEKAGLSILED